MRLNSLILGLLSGLLATECSAAARSSRLEGVELLADQVRIKTSEPVHYRYFRLENPPRLVVELLHTEASGRSYFKGDGGLIGDARVTRTGARPGAVRVAVDLTESVRHHVEADGNDLVLSFEEDILPLRDAAASLPKAPAAAPAPAPAPVQVQKQARILPPARPAEDIADEVLKLSGGQKAALAAAGLIGLALVGGRTARGRIKAHPAEFAPENESQMIEGLQENVNLLARRLSLVEKELGQRTVSFPVSVMPHGRLEEDVRAMKDVLRSLVKALKVEAEL